MILLVASDKDTASLNIKHQILNYCPFNESKEFFQQKPLYHAQMNGQIVTLVTLNEESVSAQNLPEQFPYASLIVFISKHSSLSGRPTLSVHTPGNLGNAEFGGLPKVVSVAPAVAMQTALKKLLQFREAFRLDYEVSYECTHHGPSINVPTMFVELGSSPKQWNDKLAAQIVARAALAAIVDFSSKSASAVLGIGGTHYSPKFTLMALRGEASFGHIIPKHAVSHVDCELLCQCVNKTFEKVPIAFLDWKGIKSEDKTNLIAALESAGLPYKKV